MTKHLYKSGPLSVTEKMLRFRGRRYSVAHIENLILRRPLLWLGLFAAMFLGAFGWLNQDILYERELIALGGLILASVLVTWPFGTLYIHSRTLGAGTNQGSITYWYGALARAQEAVEDVLSYRAEH